MYGRRLNGLPIRKKKKKTQPGNPASWSQEVTRSLVCLCQCRSGVTRVCTVLRRSPFSRGSDVFQWVMRSCWSTFLVFVCVFYFFKCRLFLLLEAFYRRCCWRPTWEFNKSKRKKEKNKKTIYNNRRQKTLTFNEGTRWVHSIHTHSRYTKCDQQQQYSPPVLSLM